jgi:phosphoglycolate phosphatase
MSNAPGLLIFDWDGTLSNSLARIVACLQISARDCGLIPPTDEAGREIIGLGLGEALRTLFPGLEDGDLETLRESYSRHYADMDREPAPLYPGVLDTLVALRDGGFVLAVATGKSRRGYDRVVNGHGLGDFFHASRCADETASKPDPLMLHQLLNELSFAPDDALMVGDTEFDMDMAVRAGVPRVAVSYGAHHVSRLHPYRLVGCLDDFAGLLKLV